MFGRAGIAQLVECLSCFTLWISSTKTGAERSAGVAPEVNLGEHVTHTAPPIADKAAHSDFETQKRRQQKSKTGVSVAPQKGLMCSNH